MELEALDDVEVRDTETPDNIVEGFKTPTIRMYFETIEKARNYYECYGRENGFWIRTRGSEKGRNRLNEVTKHAEKVCTRNVFNKFKDEWSKVFHYKVENVRNDDCFQSFVVKSKDDELEKFEVTLDSQTYEEHFILPQWRQKANKFRIIDSQGLVHDDGKKESEALRLSHMCQEATKSACLAAPSIEAFTIYIEGMNALFEKIQEVSKVSPIEICADEDNEKFTEPSPSQILVFDPNISICKGRKKEVKGKAAST
ncbi:hypothetical protein RHMOL_Rhmol04G0259700 [Rhododendron molle]|uniref:Uncharacterized protein n=1 Tax=Rhododendron molle TaxID=49168 RepID=A0ACC0P4Q2_RHOML|nr:hypothetical protein RHMOL_Rhmol04G0259700 [Rhododendron molle]